VPKKRKIKPGKKVPCKEVEKKGGEREGAKRRGADEKKEGEGFIPILSTMGGRKNLGELKPEIVAK